MFRLFLTKINEIIVYFCVHMKRKIHFNHLIVCTLCALSTIVVAQEAKTILNAPSKLDSLLTKKINLDREVSEKKLFTIQVFYGNFEATTAVLEAFEAKYPELPAKLVFETPNYKIRAGNFATEREALEVLMQIKARFKAAFVLKP